MSKKNTKSKTNIKRVMAHLTEATATTDSAAGVYAFLDQPAVSSVATPLRSTTSEYDDTETTLERHNAFPPDYPEHKKGENSVRIVYLKINTDQADSAFRSVVQIYLKHVLKTHAQTMSNYPYAKEYLTNNPLGLIEYPENDPRIFKNADKIVKARKALAQSSQTSTATASKATAPADEADLADATSATGARKGKKKKKKDKKQKEGAATAQASSAHVPASVKTDFANHLATLQREMYLYLRAAINKFMDSNCNEILKEDIHKYETKNGLIGEARLDPETRYTWKQTQEVIKAKCCLLTTGGYHFNVYYTTYRKHGVLINVWCSDMVKITDKLKKFSPQWASLADTDAVKRLTSFFSEKERTHLERELMSNHSQKWEAHDQCLRLYFDKAKFDDVVQLVRDVDISKFPSSFDPYRHTPEAMEGTLFQFRELSLKQEACDKAVRAAEARAEKAESRANAAEARAKRAEQNRRTPRKENSSRDNSGNNRTPTKDTTASSQNLAGESTEVSHSSEHSCAQRPKDKLWSGFRGSTVLSL